MPVLLEVIVQTLADAREAARGGADRLEVVRDSRHAGLTPPLSLVHAIASETPLPLRVILRENDGFSMNPTELPALRRAAMEFVADGVDGLVIGFARNGLPALDDVLKVLEVVPDVRATFHRAFDRLSDPLAAIDELANLRYIDRVLTDGGGGPAESRCERLRQYAMRAAGRVEIIAGGGVDEEAFTVFARMGCVREIHVGRIAREGRDPEGPVSADRVRRLRDLTG